MMFMKDMYILEVLQFNNTKKPINFNQMLEHIFS